MPDVKQIMEHVNSQENRDRISADYDRYTVYNGKLRDLIQKAITKEFILPETVRDLVGRIIPVNITQKICNKLAAVYREAPVRFPVDGNELDLEALDFYVDEMQFNRLMKHANRMFKLHKHVALEPYLSQDGQPKMRVLPSHTYTPYSDDPIEPNKPTAMVKHLFMSSDPDKSRYAIWTEQNHWIVNGNGAVMTDDMVAMNNPDGVNPYGILPFVFIKDSDDLLVPISDDDLISLQVAICLLLTDLAFASKFSSWGIIYLIGVENERISFNPNSVITLPHPPGTEKPEIGTVKQQLDSDAMLRQVEALVALLLTTKNLSVGSVSGQLNVQNSASGVAKLIDAADTTEDREDQIAFFSEAEKEYWWKFAHNILPVWVKTGNMDPEFVKKFSEPFELGIQFPEFRPMMGDNERLDIEIKKLDQGLTTKRDAIKSMNPELTDFEIDQIIADINKEKLSNVKFFEKNMQDEEQPQELE